MTQSLMERLRDPRGFDWGDVYALTTEAANEIERLTEALRTIEQGPAKDEVSMTQEALIARAALGGEE